MSAGLTSVFLAVLLGWIAWGVASLAMSAPLSLGTGAAVGVLSVALFRNTMALNGLVAVLEPIGVILPLLVLRQAAGHLGWQIPAFSSPELAAFLVFYILFLAAAMGALPVDPYRLGYAPVPVAVIVLVLCAYGALTGNWFIPVAAVAGQALWVAGWGSSNYFDHTLHATLVPVVAVVLIGRLVGG